MKSVKEMWNQLQNSRIQFQGGGIGYTLPRNQLRHHSKP